MCFHHFTFINELIPSFKFKTNLYTSSMVLYLEKLIRKVLSATLLSKPYAARILLSELFDEQAEPAETKIPL